MLLDLDGVLVDSRECVEFAWREWARARGVDVAPFLAIHHGRLISETIRCVAPHLDAKAEASFLDRIEECETRGVKALPGAADLLRHLPPGRHALVTSASRRVADLRLRAAGLPVSSTMITGDLVGRGKPDPEGYLAGAKVLQSSPADCLAVEDAPAGIAAARAAGIRVLALLTTNPATALADADAFATDLAGVHLRVLPSGLEVHSDRWLA
jgi:sugar-phosphatase